MWVLVFIAGWGKGGYQFFLSVGGGPYFLQLESGVYLVVVERVVLSLYEQAQCIIWAYRCA